MRRRRQSSLLVRKNRPFSLHSPFPFTLHAQRGQGASRLLLLVVGVLTVHAGRSGDAEAMQFIEARCRSPESHRRTSRVPTHRDILLPSLARLACRGATLPHRSARGARLR